MKKITIAHYVRAMRIPFISASVLPFVFGSLICLPNFNFFIFILGLIAVIFTHVSANLINDYADSKTGVDSFDKYFYGFFGGSKLIQEGVLSAQVYLKLAIICFAVGGLSVVLMALYIGSFFVLASYLVIVFLGLSYSHKPFQFSYNYLGELVIFILFGPALVMGAVYLQTLEFPTLVGFLGSLPFGFFTTAILFANELPDTSEDRAANKRNLSHLFSREKVYRFYYVLIAFGFLSIFLNLKIKTVHPFSWSSFIFIVLALKAAKILRNFCYNKKHLVESSRLTILLHAMVSVFLIAGAIL
jgi:1,4-dihydroxy-2-naphthoate polyprenyltransferase